MLLLVILSICTATAVRSMSEDWYNYIDWNEKLQTVFSWYNTSSSVECPDEFCSFEYGANLISLIFNFKNTYPAYTPVLVLLPVAGWINDSLLGRYRAITAGSFLIAVAYDKMTSKSIINCYSSLFFFITEECIQLLLHLSLLDHTHWSHHSQMHAHTVTRLVPLTHSHMVNYLTLHCCSDMNGMTSTPTSKMCLCSDVHFVMYLICRSWPEQDFLESVTLTLILRRSIIIIIHCVWLFSFFLI